MTKNKIQSIIVAHLLKHGQLEIKLPDGVTVEMGLTQENENGELKIKDNYCWVMTSRRDRIISMDSYNMGLKFSDEENVFVFEDKFVDKNGDSVRRLDVV